MNRMASIIFMHKMLRMLPLHKDLFIPRYNATGAIVFLLAIAWSFVSILLCSLDSSKWNFKGGLGKGLFQK